MCQAAVAMDPPILIPLHRNRVFTAWWITQLVSSLGTSISTLALPLLALKATGSAAEAGWVLGCAEFGLVAATPITGLLADRVHRARLMLIANIALACAAIALACVVGDNGAVPLYDLIAYTLANGAFGSLSYASSAGLLPQIVGDSQLEEAYARNSTRQTIAQVLGPLIGGALFAVHSSLPFLVDGCTFAVAVLGNLFMIRRIPRQIRTSGSGDSGWRTITAGVRHIARHRITRNVAMTIVALNICFSALSFLIIVRARELGATSTDIGVLAAIAAFGGLIGSLFVPLVMRTNRRTLTLSASSAVVVVSLAVLALSSLLPVIAVAFAVMFLAAPSLDAQITALLTRSTPDHVRGRVNASLQASSQGLQWIAPGSAGALLAVISIHVLIGGLALTMAGSAILLVTALKSGYSPAQAES